MGNEFSIAAITVSLRNLLHPITEIADSALGSFPEDLAPTAEVVINSLPLDEAYDFDNSKNQLNIFLYHVEHSPAWRNTAPGPGLKNGESGHAALGLNLYYIITAYGQDNNEIIGQLLLGKAMSILHDHPVFSKEEVESAFPGSRLHEQVERIRITPQPISVDDVSKLWTGFQTQYKLSVAYQVSIVLIESTRPARTPLPVLMRGANDRGVIVQPFVIPPYPTLEAVRYPFSRQAVQPGDDLVFTGHHLLGDSVTLLIRNLRTGDELSRTANPGGTDSLIRFTIPGSEPTLWAPGLYSLTAVIHKTGEPDRSSNDSTFALAPVISLIQMLPLSPPLPGGFLGRITCTTDVHPEQKALLLLGDRAFKALDRTTTTNVLQFEMRNVPPGSYYVRLRVDGADSLLILDNVTPPVFNPAHQVTLS